MIICCGEALIDMIPVTSGTGTKAFAPIPGGAIFNTAIALGRLEVPVGLVSGVSEDLFGAQLAATLDKSGVVTRFLMRSNRPTTLAFVDLKDGHAEYTFYDENSAGRLIEQSDLPELPSGLSALYFGGISLCAEPAAGAYEALMRRAAGDHLTMLDPNIRPGFISDPQAYRARLSRMIAMSDIVKVSDEDLDWIIADAPGTDAKVRALQELGAKAVIVTKGKDGASAWVRHLPVVDVPARPVAVADTVGAGDTFNAGFLAKLRALDRLSKADIASISHEDLSDALGYAVKVAAVTVSRPGADPPFLSELSV